MPRVLELQNIAGLKEALEIVEKRSDGYIATKWDRGYECALGSVEDAIRARIKVLEGNKDG